MRSRSEFSTRNVDSFFRARLKEEAERLFLTYPMANTMSRALSTIPEVRMCIMGGGRGYTTLGKVEKYQTMVSDSSIDVWDGDVTKTIKLDYRNRRKRILTEKEWELTTKRINRYFTAEGGTHSDFDIAAVVVDDNSDKRQIHASVHEAIKNVLETQDSASLVERLSNAYERDPRFIKSIEGVESLWDFREDFTFYRTEFLGFLNSFLEHLETQQNTSQTNGTRQNGVPKYVKETLTKGAVIVYEKDVDIDTYQRIEKINQKITPPPTIRRVDEHIAFYDDYARRIIGSNLGPVFRGLALEFLENRVLSGQKVHKEVVEEVGEDNVGRFFELSE